MPDPSRNPEYPRGGYNREEQPEGTNYGQQSGGHPYSTGAYPYQAPPEGSSGQSTATYITSGPSTVRPPGQSRAGAPSQPPSRGSRRNEGSELVYAWFIPGDGISRSVIQADVQRYLGPDAHVRPGTRMDARGYEISGYEIAGYKTFTSAQIQDLQADSANFEREKRERRDPNLKYIRSRVHEQRQHWGASDLRPAPDQPAPPQDRPGPPPSNTYYNDYMAQPSSYTAQQQQYSGYYQAGSANAESQRPRYIGQALPSQYQEPPANSSAANPPPPNNPAASQYATSTPTHYLASDGNWYEHERRH